MARVLLVEDNMDLRVGVEALLEDEGYGIISVSNGAEAMEALTGDQLPDVILLDLMMPVMNGFEVLKSLHRDGRLAEIPVVVTSASGGQIPISADAVLCKPYCADDLLDVLSRFSPGEHHRVA